MRILTAVKDSHDTCLSVLSVLLPSPRFQPLILARGEAAVLLVKKWRLLVPEQTGAVVTALGPATSYRCRQRLTLLRGLVNWIGLAVPAVY